ncbi:glycosyltransferase family 2 protein [Candidatus Gottesmanbacteria bacterium]|nr:glycosyltransferase family 2 protein [Candidatus Gottesmanbacteria bacterium]
MSKAIESKTPPITIIIVSFNNIRTIQKCVDTISTQDYPKEKIELLNIDGGSTDQTVHILKKYGFRLIQSHISNNAEAQRAIGLKNAKNNLIVSIDADNYLPHDHWLQQMVQPFIDDPDVVHSGTLHFHYDKKDTIYNRYCALFGVLDPVVFYIGRPDRNAYYDRIPKYGRIVKETSNYFILKFTKETLTTVGCNGIAYRKDVLLKYANSSERDFLHIDVFADLIDHGFNIFAVVKTDVAHDTAVSIPQLIKKRIAFLNKYFLKSNVQSPQRRYFIYNPRSLRDRVNLFLFVLYTITLIKPLFDSIKVYVRKHDPASFLHPLMCWVFLYSYAKASVDNLLNRK